MPTSLLAAPTWTVPHLHGLDVYTPIYLLASGLNLGLLLWLGRRRGYPWRAWLVLLACASLAFILGTKLVAFSGAEWQVLLSTGQWPAQGARSVLGGAVASFLTVAALRRAFGFSRHVHDVLALPAGLMLALQCVGCVLTGCCFGAHTAGGWGLTYGPGTWAYLVQQQQGLLPEGALHSLPVHPTQLYTLLLCAGVGLLLWYTRHRPWPAGSRHWLNLGLLLAGRWLIEFWRDPAGEPVGATPDTLLGLTMLRLQWVLLPAASAALLVGWWQMRRQPQAATPEAVPQNSSGHNLLAVAGLLALTASLGPQALALPELLVIKGLLLMVLVLEGGAWLLRSSAQPGQVALPLGLACTVLVLTSQAPVDSARTTTEFSFGGSRGAYKEDVRDGGGCSGPTTHTQYDHQYRVYGGNVEVNRDHSGHKLAAYGLGVWAGREQINYRELDPTTGGLLYETDSTKHLFDINPYIEGHSRLQPNHFGYGYRVGLHIGSLYHANDKNAVDTPLAPEIGIWMGVREKIFLQADANNGLQGVGNSTARVALGSGLGQLNGSTVLAGWAAARHHPAPGMGFVSAQIRLRQTGLTLYPYAATDFSHHYQLAFRLGYRFSSRR